MKKTNLFALLFAGIMIFNNNNVKSQNIVNETKSKIISFNTEETNFDKLEKGIITNIDISKDNKKVFSYFNGKDSEIYLENDGKLINISKNKGWDGHPTISDDGKIIYFASEQKIKNKKKKVIVMANTYDILKKKKVKLILQSNPEFEADYPETSAKGDSLFYSQTNKKNIELIFLDKSDKNKKAKIISKDGENSQANYQNGKLTFIKEYENKKGNYYQSIIVADLKTGENKTIKKSMDNFYSSPKISPDGNKVIYIQNYNQIKLYNLKTKKQFSVSKAYLEGGVSSPTWSSNNGFVSFIAVDNAKEEQNLYVARISNDKRFYRRDDLKKAMSFEGNKYFFKKYQEEGFQASNMNYKNNEIIFGSKNISEIDNPFFKNATAKK